MHASAKAADAYDGAGAETSGDVSAGFPRKPLVPRHSRAGRRLVGRAGRLTVVSVLCFRVWWIVGWDWSAGLGSSPLCFCEPFRTGRASEVSFVQVAP